MNLIIKFCFQSLFPSYPDDLSFWAQFADEQKRFNEKYNMLNNPDLFEGLSYEGETFFSDYFLNF